MLLNSTSRIYILTIAIVRDCFVIASSIIRFCIVVIISAVVVFSFCNSDENQESLVPTVGENGNWWIGDTDTGVKAAADDSIPVGSGNVTEAEGVNTVTVVAIVIACVALLGNILLAVLVLKKKKSLV